MAKPRLTTALGPGVRRSFLWDSRFTTGDQRDVRSVHRWSTIPAGAGDLDLDPLAELERIHFTENKPYGEDPRI